MMRLTPANLFGLGISVLAWIAATGALLERRRSR